ncbi:MAG: DUF1573 domain-containing protein [Planctomycetes bacterium]|nr:DUF1573 domain-containing protein [Planctomycetota bacterium]
MALALVVRASEVPRDRNGRWSDSCVSYLSVVADDRVSAAPADADQLGPRVATEQEEHDFGKADVGGSGEHAFAIKNAGSLPLRLSLGKTTCGCCTCVCQTTFPPEDVLPGNSVDVVLKWTSKHYVGSFRATSTILTNDPRRPEVRLAVTGRFTGPVGVVPARLVFSGVRVGHAASGEVRVFSYLDEPLEIVGADLPDAHVRVAWHPLSAEQLRDDPTAKAGYRVCIDLDAGMPAGTFHHTIRLKTTSRTTPRIDIPVEGAITNDISVAGRGWNPQTGAVTIGSVQSRDGTQWSLLLVARGSHAKDARFQLVNVFPDVLDVELAPTRYVSETDCALCPLKIRIAPGSIAATHLEPGQLGRITIQTSHPVLPQLDILVRFAITN